MKNQKGKRVLITSVLGLAAFWAFIIIEKNTTILKGIDIYIFFLIIIIGAISMYIAFKKDKEEKQGLKTEDELSNIIKYKSGYHAYLISMYMWLFIFILKDWFPDTETMLGGGILLSATIFYITKVVVKRRFYE